MNQKIRQILDGKEENHVMPFFWQHGEDEATLREYMQVIHNDHIGAVCVESRPHPDFCGPGWWHDMDIILDEAKKLGMKVWILDDSHFPTGYANGALKDAPPEKRRRSIVESVIEVPADAAELHIALDSYKKAYAFVPSQIERNIFRNHRPKELGGDRLLAVTAIRENGDGIEDTMDLLQEAGIQPGETAPEGEVCFTRRPGDTSSWLIHIIQDTANRGPHRDYINMMDRESASTLITAVYEPHYAHYHDLFGNVIAGFFSDEPEIGNGHLYEFGKRIHEMDDEAWSREVEAELREKWGSNFGRLLPLIFSQNFAPELPAKVRCDYMNSVTRAVERDFSLQLGDWCHAHGVEYIGHLIEDTRQHTRTGSSLGHYFRGLSGQDMAGIDDIGGQVIPYGEKYPDHGTNPLQKTRDGEFWHYELGKLGSSLGAIDPRKKGRTMCEIFGAYGWEEGTSEMKYLADHMLVRGVNFFVPHAFDPAPFPDTDCPPHFYAHGNNPEYRHFGALMHYMNRAATLLSGGKPVIPAAILYVAEADWSGGDYEWMQKPAHILYDHQIDYHFLPADVFTEKKYGTITENGTLTVNGISYRTFLIPKMQFLTEPAARAAVRLCEDGGNVFFLEERPEYLLGENPDARLLETMQKIPVVRTVDLPKVLAEKHCIDLSIEPSNDRIRVYHYQNPEDLYFVVNEGKTTYTGRILPEDGTRMHTAFDLWNNEIRPLSSDGSFTLESGKSLVLLPESYEKAEGTQEEMGRDVPAEDPASMEKISFEKGWTRSIARAADYPAFTGDAVIDLPDTLDQEKPEFSGFVRYEKKLTKDSESRRTVLEITKAYDAVEVFVNGESLGMELAAPFRYDLTEKLTEGENIIRIEAATTLERQSHSFPNPYAAFTGPLPPSTVPTGIYGTVNLYLQK